MLSLEKHFHNLAIGGSATLNMNTSTFSKIKILAPYNQIVDEYFKKANSMFDKILLNQKENKPLTQRRDTLLPQLISGKVRVPDMATERLKGDVK